MYFLFCHSQWGYIFILRFASRAGLFGVTLFLSVLPAFVFSLVYTRFLVDRIFLSQTFVLADMRLFSSLDLLFMEYLELCITNNSTSVLLFTDNYMYSCTNTCGCERSREGV